jgi:hypothetical protein
MFTLAQLHSAAPLASLTAPASSSGGPSLIVMVLVALGVIWVLAVLFARPTVVVVEQSSGLAGLLAVVVVAGIIVLFVIGSTSGVT